MRIPKGDIAKYMDTAAVGAYGARFSQRDVGLMLGISPRQVGRILHIHHVPAMNNPVQEWEPETIARWNDWAFRTDLDNFYIGILHSAPCELCGCAPIEIDHIEAWSKGGADHWENFAGLCSACNAAKGTKSLLGMLAGLTRQIH